MINKVRHYFNWVFSFLGADQAGRPAPAGQGVSWPLHPHWTFNTSRSSLSRWHGCGHQNREGNLSANGRENHQNQATSSCSGTVWWNWAKLSAISIWISVLIVNIHHFNKRRKRNFGNKVYSLPHLHESNNCQWLSYSSRSLLNCGIVYHISNSIFTLPLSGHQIQRVYKCEPHFFASMILLSLILTTGWLKIRKSRHLLCVDICIPFIYIHISHSSHPY